MAEQRHGPEHEDDEDDVYEPRNTRDDTLSSLIPYQNASALTAYYCGVFSLIPCLGLILGPIALYSGFAGLNYANEHPEAKGRVHAVVGILLGGLTSLLNFGAVLFFGFAFFIAATTQE